MAEPTLQGVVLGRERSGPYATVRFDLHRAMGAYMREGKWRHLKVGITNDPHVRWANAYRDYGWHALVCVYRTTSQASVRAMERWLIWYAHMEFIDRVPTGTTIPARHCAADFFIYNEVGGGGGRLPEGGPPYYVYFALAAPYARIRKK